MIAANVNILSFQQKRITGIHFFLFFVLFLEKFNENKYSCIFNFQLLFLCARMFCLHVHMSRCQLSLEENAGATKS